MERFVHPLESEVARLEEKLWNCARLRSAAEGLAKGYAKQLGQAQAYARRLETHVWIAYAFGVISGLLLMWIRGNIK